MALFLPPQAYLTEASPQSSGGHFYDPCGYCNYERFHEEKKPQEASVPGPELRVGCHGHVPDTKQKGLLGSGGKRNKGVQPGPANTQAPLCLPTASGPQAKDEIT